MDQAQYIQLVHKTQGRCTSSDRYELSLANERRAVVVRNRGHRSPVVCVQCQIDLITHCLLRCRYTRYANRSRMERRQRRHTSSAPGRHSCRLDVGGCIGL